MNAKADTGTTRRRFVVAAIGLTGVATGTLGPAAMRAGLAWAQSGRAVDDSTLDVMTKMARRLFPHEALSDRAYLDVLNAALAAPAEDDSFATILADAEAALDAGQPRRFVDLEATAQIEVLRRHEQADFFLAIQAAVRNGIYTHPEFLSHIGYPGPSFAAGGYLNRGAGEIDWLPEDA
jgi:hypothetical protein